MFLIQAGRGQEATQKLLGVFDGILHCDRRSGYNGFGGLRQLCWAHLKRDFQALSEVKGTMGRIGSELFALAKRILRLRRRVRDGTLSWATFHRRMEPLMQRVETLLARGAERSQPLAGRCRRIFNQWHYLWTFVYDARVEPTNNLAERIVRQAVLWRKGSFGTQSERGARYAEWIPSVCATCRLQGRSVIEYLRHACRCHLEGIPTPSLIEAAGCLAKNSLNAYKFLELASARQTLCWFLDNNIKMPRLHKDAQVDWKYPRYSTIMNFLKSPVCAGIYVYGRTQTQQVLTQVD